MFSILKKKHTRYGNLIFTFPNGQKVYQVKDEYFEMLPAKKLMFIQENSNYIAFLGISKHTLHAGHRKIKEQAYKIMAQSELRNKEELRNRCNDLVKLVDQIDTTREEYDKTNEAIMVSLFDLFFFLDNETPFEWSEESVERKRNLLNEYPYFRNFFFQKLNSFMSDYKVTLQNCINFALIQTQVQEVVKEIAKDLSHTNTSEDKTN